MTETAIIPKIDYEEEARKTRELLKHRGWCLWRCHAFNGDLVVVVRDNPPMLESQGERMMLQLQALKEPYVIYTETELGILCENPNPRLLHEAKRAGAVITGKAENNGP
jgi:hypothetical protein